MGGEVGVAEAGQLAGQGRSSSINMRLDLLRHGMDGIGGYTHDVFLLKIWMGLLL